VVLDRIIARRQADMDAAANWSGEGRGHQSSRRQLSRLAATASMASSRAGYTIGYACH